MADFDDLLDLYVELKRLKQMIRSAEPGEQIATEPVKSVKLEGRKGDLHLVYTVTE